MKILVLGGTGFIGTHCIEQLRHRGHAIDTLVRGQSQDALPKDVKRWYGTREDGLTAAGIPASAHWDACIDISGYTAPQVRTIGTELSERVEHYIYVSAVMAYADPTDGPVDESFPLKAPIDEATTILNGETYGRLKVTCERIVRTLFPGKATILRPQSVIGPKDPSGRLAYWLQRAQKNQLMLAPGDGRDHLQFVDVQDVAAYIVQLIERRQCGTWNLSGHRVTWQHFFDVLAPSQHQWVAREILQHAGLTFRELPLFRAKGTKHSQLMNISHQKAYEQGFRPRTFQQSIEEMKAWLEGTPDATPNDIVAEWLTPTREAQLLGQTS